MIPIRDPRGRVIGFGGRILGEGEPKYLNSPQTILFDKGRTLYNLDRAGPASRTAKRLIVVEGYMDVIALDRAGIAEVVAPNGTALTEGAARAAVAARSVADPLLRRRQRRARRRRSGLRRARCPCSAPIGRCASSSFPPGQDPDDVIRTGGREAFEALLANRRAARRAAVAARAGGRAAGHARSLGGPQGAADRPCLGHRPRRPRPNVPRGLAQPLLRAAAARRTAAPARHSRRRSRGTFKNGRFVPPDPPVGDGSPGHRIASGIDAPTARALILGFANYPEELPAHCEQLASLPIADKRTAKMRDELVNAAFSGAALDREGVSTILGGRWSNGRQGAQRAMGFSFTRRDSDPDRARSDLAAAVEIIAAAEEVEQALEHATERLKRDITDEAYEEQQRLIEAQQGLRQRLAQLAGTD